MSGTKFTWFPKLTETCERVPPEYRGELMLALVEYGTYGTVPELEWPLDAIFVSLREDIDNSKEMRARGARGGRPPKETKVEPASEEAKPDYDVLTAPENQDGDDISESGNQDSDKVSDPENQNADVVSESENLDADRFPTPETKVEPASEEAKPNPYQSIPIHTKPEEVRVARARRPSAFSPPSAEEVEAYCRAHEPPLRVDAARFVDYFEAQGWRLSNGNRMRDWRAAARNWSNRERPRSGQMVTGGEVDAKYAML